MYSVWVEGWLRFFPGNQLLLVKVGDTKAIESLGHPSSL
jgi:hypothetical protein